MLHYDLSSQLALHGMVHSFIELHKPIGHDKAVIHKEITMLSNCGVGEDSWEFLGLQEDQTSQS